MDVKWVKIRSWHAVRSTISRVPNDVVREGLFASTTLCGRIAGPGVVDDLPAERSCESCLRIIARKSDA